MSEKRCKREKQQRQNGEKEEQEGIPDGSGPSLSPLFLIIEINTENALETSGSSLRPFSYKSLSKTIRKMLQRSQNPASALFLTNVLSLLVCIHSPGEKLSVTSSLHPTFLAGNVTTGCKLKVKEK